MTSLLLLAAISVTPVYTNLNRASGWTPTMLNLKPWAEAVEEAIGSGGVDTNSVNALIRSYDVTNLTARIGAKQDKLADYTTTNSVRSIVSNAVPIRYVASLPPPRAECWAAIYQVTTVTNEFDQIASDAAQLYAVKYNGYVDYRELSIPAIVGGIAYFDHIPQNYGDTVFLYNDIYLTDIAHVEGYEGRASLRYYSGSYSYLCAGGTAISKIKVSTTPIRQREDYSWKNIGWPDLTGYLLKTNAASVYETKTHAAETYQQKGQYAKVAYWAYDAIPIWDFVDSTNKLSLWYYADSIHETSSIVKKYDIPLKRASNEWTKPQTFWNGAYVSYALLTNMTDTTVANYKLVKDSIDSSFIGGTQNVNRVTASFDSSTNYWNSKQDALPYQTNAIPATAITNAPWLTEHQSLSFTNDYRRKAEKINWGDVTNRSEVVSFTKDSIGQNSALTVGRRSTGTVGYESVSVGNGIVASGQISFAGGYQTKATNDMAFVWNGDTENAYGSHGEGTFNINAPGNENGVYVGSRTLYSVITNVGSQSFVPWVTDRTGSKTAITVGNRNSSYDVGSHTVAFGNDVNAVGDYSFAEGVGTVAEGAWSHAAGYLARADEDASFVWNGDFDSLGYISKGLGSFCINPYLGIDGFYIGDLTLYDHITNSVVEVDPTVPAWAKRATPPESMTGNAVVLTNGILRTKSGETIAASSAGGAVTTNDVNGIVSSKGFATTSWVGNQGYSTTNQLQDVIAVVQTWEGFLDGSNVVFSITNYLTGTYHLEAAKLRILEMTNGVYHEVYNSRDEIVLHINDFRTNDLQVATNNLATALGTEISAKADKAWGKYSSGGQELASIGISNAVYMTAPSTVFAGGLEYERVVVGAGVVGVLTVKGAQAYTQGQAGMFQFRDATSTNFFGWTKTDDYVIGCRTDAITTQTIGANTMVSLTYDLISTTYPILFYMPTLAGYSTNTWEQLNYADGTSVPGATYAVEWVEGVESFIAKINCGAAGQGFFMAKVMVSGDAAFETNMKAKFSGGILCTDGIHVIKPVYNAGSVTWEVQ